MLWGMRGVFCRFASGMVGVAGEEDRFEGLDLPVRRGVPEDIAERLRFVDFQQDRGMGGKEGA